MGKVLPYLLLGTERPWILGGQGDTSNVSSSTEFYTGDSWKISENNYLQEEKFAACATLSNNTELIVLIGGKKTFREVESFFGEETNVSKHVTQDDARSLAEGIIKNLRYFTL